MSDKQPPVSDIGQGRKVRATDKPASPASERLAAAAALAAAIVRWERTWPPEPEQR